MSKPKRFPFFHRVTCLNRHHILDCLLLSHAFLIVFVFLRVFFALFHVVRGWHFSLFLIFSMTAIFNHVFYSVKTSLLVPSSSCSSWDWSAANVTLKIPLILWLGGIDCFLKSTSPFLFCIPIVLEYVFQELRQIVCKLHFLGGFMLKSSPTIGQNLGTKIIFFNIFQALHLCVLASSRTL